MQLAYIDLSSDGIVQGRIWYPKQESKPANAAKNKRYANIISPKLVSAYHRTNISDRKNECLLAAAVESFGS